MNELSTLRLYLLRAMYLLMAVGLGITIWPQIIAPPDDLTLMGSVVRALLGAIGLLSLLGLRYPVKMVPLLLFELAWKLIWVLAFGLPLWRDGALDAAAEETLFACLMGIVLVPIAVPWGHVVHLYLRAPGDRWGPPKDAGASAVTGGGS